MDWIMEYTADSTDLLREWRAKGAAPKQFLREVRKHCIYEGICWRGTSLRSISMHSPVLSASKDIHVAFNFSLNHYKAAIVAFVGYEAYNISSSSVHPQEEEVILVLTEEIALTHTGWLEGTPVYLARKSKNIPLELVESWRKLWEQEVKYEVNRFQSFLTDYDL